MYGGRVILEYKDSSHRYSATVDGVKLKPSSVTTIKGQTLEKNGLQTWPMGLAMRHLLGFYDFDDDNGNRKTGFSEGVGVLWDFNLTDREGLIEHCKAATKLWTVRQKEGADIGTLVHDAVEQYISGTPFDITVDAYRERVAEKEGADAITAVWEEKAPSEVEQANQAFNAFKAWWKGLGATVVFAEEILYSIEFNLAGTCDYMLTIPGKGLVLADLKTTKASARAGAPQGVYYDFMIQLGIYAAMLVEMGMEKPNDLMIISARKDGGFNPVYASELGLTVDECIDWGKHVIECYYFMRHTKKAITVLAGGEEKED